MNKQQLKNAIPFKQIGFTMTELLMALAVAGVVVAMAIPTFKTMINTSQMNSQTNRILEALNIARSKAISSHWNAIVAPTTSGNWNGDIQVFLDKNSNNAVDTGELLQTFNDPTDLVTINSTYPSRITFTPDGRGVAGSFNVCTPSSITTPDYRRIIVALTGRIRVQTATETGVAYSSTCP